MSKKTYAFWLHYNKPAAAKAKRAMWSVHYRNKCHIVNDIVIDGSVKVQTRARKRQPMGVIAGKAERVEITGDVAYIS